MIGLTWNTAGERFYEVGVDRGVLYPQTGPGVAWNGLINVSENLSGGEAVPYYIDGVKYLNFASQEEFNATITAYTYPDEFAACDGTASDGHGLTFGLQSRESFGLSYRTMVGNDTDGTDYGYKIHIIYNALAAPSERSYDSISDSADPLQFSWEITTTPVVVAGKKPTPHIVIDSRTTDPYLLEAIEELLYGAGSVQPALPTMQQIITLFDEWVTLIVTDNGDGTWTATGPDPVIRFTSETEFEIEWHTANPINETSYVISTG